jgi:predicted secreted protein with PEFG-CTERM motif
MKVLLMMLTAIIIVGGINGISAETPRMEYTLEFQEAQSQFQVEKESISVATDKPDYQGIQTIEVSGHSTITPIILMVTAPNGNLITVAQVETDLEGNYSTEITVGGALYDNAGTYTITSTSQGFETSTTFGYGTLLEYIEEPQSQPSLSDITYEISGGEVDSIYNDPEALSITVDLINADGGEIVLTLPRDVIDSTIDGVDEVFFVLVDGYETQYTEVATDLDRTITIPFVAEAGSIEIIGTYVIPEFGTIAMMILAVAIISMVVVTKKARLVAI